MAAFKLITKLEDIRPSLEPAHAWSECIRLAPKLKKSDVLVVNNCGKGYKDKKIYIEQLGYYPKWKILLTMPLRLQKRKIDLH